MTYFPPPQQIYQPPPPPQIPAQYIQPQYQQPMTPCIPPKTGYPSNPYQPPIIPQINQTAAPVNIPAGISFPPGQIIQPSQIPQPQPLKKAPPQQQQNSLISSSLNQKNNERFQWSTKKEKMKWGLAESIEIKQIVNKGDLNSVLFYLNQFMSVNITNEDLKKFGSMGALNAFCILQLGVEYLLKEYNEIKGKQDISADQYTDLVNEYNEQVDVFQKAINEREVCIEKLRKQKSDLENRVAELKQRLKDEVSKNKKKHGHKQTSTIHVHKHQHQHQNAPKNETSESYEPGELHNSTAVNQFKQEQQSNKTKKNRPKFTDTTQSNIRSDGEASGTNFLVTGSDEEDEDDENGGSEASQSESEEGELTSNQFVEYDEVESETKYEDEDLQEGDDY